MATSALGYQSFYQAQLTSNIDDTDLIIPLDTAPIPEEGFLVIESTVASKREIIYYTSKTSNSVTCPSGAGNGRGYDGTTAVSHLSGAAVIMAPVGAMFESLTDLFTTTPQGWTNIDAPSTVTANGNRSYTLTHASSVASTVSAGMRRRFTRTVAGPTQCADLESSSNQYFSKASATGFSTGTTWTWKAKVKLESYTVGCIASLDDGTNLLAVFVLATGQLQMNGGTIATSDVVTSYQSLPLNKWVDVTISMTIGTPTGEVRFDDVVVPSFVTASAATTFTVGTPTLYIGRSSAGNYFDGKIAQVAIFSAIISDATLKTYSGQTMTGSETNCKGFWSLNNTLNDLSSSANNLTASGGAAATNADSPFGNSGVSSTLEYALTMSVSSDGLTEVVQVPEGCALPTTGGITASAYSTNANPYGWPGVDNTLGYAEIRTVPTGTTIAQIPGISVPITIPTGGRRVRITIGGVGVGNTGAGSNIVKIWNGVVSSGTLLQALAAYVATATGQVNLNTSVELTMPAGSYTINGSMEANAGTWSISASATAPYYLKVEALPSGL